MITFNHIPIEEQVVVLFPGQGAQHVGMGKKINKKPQEIGGPKSKLDQTIYCQPAMFVSSLAAWEKAKLEEETLDSRVTDVAGFSVGEFAAFVLAGILSFKDVANYLFCGVKVVGASETCMQFLESTQEKYSFQVVKRLAVSGAFHTALMKDAVDIMKEALKDVTIQLPPRVNIYSNYTGKLHTYKDKQIREAIIKQICSPVKWEQIQQLLHSKHQNYKFPRFMEVGPGKQLGAMLLRISKKAYKNYMSYPV
ncbi:unnamed protein product [Gongylonema pulchrum]|uniref:PKS_AT domain-containing protein n=1 Tax=Gongylonema pulchrum TaxID=637853 RepID=A0A183DSY3_9BILA|nr:unnamed protein product [Gongylonema pulchrum]